MPGARVTQLDLPQLSLERYVDLVRRRRWQLVPISLLGLVVGGLVAFFIPRYYVAEVVVEHKAPPDYRPDLREDDPFRRIVDSAEETIKLTVGETMRALRWPDAAVADPSVRTRNEKTVQDRVQVEDKNAQQRNRNYAQIRITYRDRDGDRAATFANTLAATWIVEQVADMRAPVDLEWERVNDAATDHQRTYETLSRDKQDIEQRYGIRPDFLLTAQNAELRALEVAHREDRDRLQQLNAQRAQLAQTVTRLREQLAELPERVDADPALLAGLAKDNPVVAQLLVVHERNKSALGNSTEGTRKWRQDKRAFDESEAMVAQLLMSIGADADGKLPNPKAAALQRQLDQDLGTATQLDEQIRQLERAIAAEQQRLDDLRVGYAQLAVLEQRLLEATTSRDEALAALRSIEDTRTRLRAEPPIKVIRQATVPEHPTDPNIVIVALIGCVLGLGVAIGLILLLDVLGGSFKTVDDVERGLQVPVLGGLSHLETEEERVTAARSRRRAAAAAFGFVGLVVVVVTIFYVAPTRLPPVVRDLLALLLGS